MSRIAAPLGEDRVLEGRPPVVPPLAPAAKIFTDLLVQSEGKTESGEAILMLEISGAFQD